MVKKKTFAASSWRSYMLQLSVVIVGIVVTFVGSDLISRWSRHRQVKATMQLVVEELKGNRANLENSVRRLMKDRHGMEMFMHYRFDVDQIPQDSLAFYASPHIIGSSVGFTWQGDALEVLKSSGIITSVSDVHVLMEVMRIYTRLSDFNDALREYNAQKNRAINHLFENMSKSELERMSIGENDVRDSWKTMLKDPVCNSFMGFSAYFFGDDDNLSERVAQVDQTIALIQEKYDLK